MPTQLGYKLRVTTLPWLSLISDCMSANTPISLLERRRDDIRGWLDEEAPFTDFDQKHLDADTPERAYWHHGYQAALADVIDMLNRSDEKSGIADMPR